MKDIHKELGENLAAKHYADAGWEPYEPKIDRGYDLVIVRGSEVRRIQAKYANAGHVYLGEHRNFDRLFVSCSNSQQFELLHQEVPTTTTFNILTPQYEKRRINK